ncbi:unnamed protein product [Rotaria sordida]|uniref:Uncharacterized protein n=1 Tax=Rotaria sordida TaxID=392033 RepID=A0A815A358_9BILA|nr:unnamed protein product [Rotaria sordida]CAF1531962.1 unnamed protein product [Rotaria sordida]
MILIAGAVAVAIAIAIAVAVAVVIVIIIVVCCCFGGGFALWKRNKNSRTPGRFSYFCCPPDRTKIDLIPSDEEKLRDCP